MILKTSRKEIVLRKKELRKSDIEAEFSMIERNRENFSRFHFWMVEFAVSIEKLTVYQKIFNYDVLHFLIEYHEKIVGVVGLHSISKTSKKAEMEYYLDKDYSKKGIMTEAVAALIKHSFEALELNKVIIKVTTNNEASQKIPQRLGFTLEGVLRSEYFWRDEYLDCLYFSLLRSEYEANFPKVNERIVMCYISKMVKK